MIMDHETEARLMQAVETWADLYPAPEVAAVRIMGVGGFTPGQVVESMRERNAVGELLFHVLDNAVVASSLDEVLGSFDSGPGAVAGSRARRLSLRRLGGICEHPSSCDQVASGVPLQ